MAEAPPPPERAAAPAGALSDTEKSSSPPTADTVKHEATPPNAAGSDRLSLLVISDRIITTRPLPPEGTLTLGRAPTCDLPIDDPSISRVHATLTIGSPLCLTDLGSSNGTRVGDRVLLPGDPVQLEPGDVMQLGNATLIVQARSPAVRTQRIWPHDYFEARLEEECTRAHRDSTVFAVARFAVDQRPSPGTLEKAWMASGRTSDCVGEYGPREIECLLVGADPDAAQQAIGRITKTLQSGGIQVRSGMACYPRDGRNPYELIRRASPSATRQPTPHDAAVSAAIVADRRMQDLYRLAERIAAGSIAVLILGETGVGKEVLAESVHKLSPRASKPYLKLNCAALSESLLESELFGHERGAFTGAVQAKPGLLETAAGGTVFLDEVGELPLAVQVKLLRVLEERVVLRVGGLKPRPLDVRFVAATNRDLEAEIARGTFRQDLFFRLNGATLVIPPLRERATEITDLARAFATQAARDLGLERPPPIDPDALDLLLAYSWPGNIRELRNVIERAVLVAGDAPIEPVHLPLEKMRATIGLVRTPAPPLYLAPAEAAAPISAGSVERTGPIRLDEQPLDEERSAIVEALASCAGNQTAAARRLGMSRRTLINRLERYGISGPRKKR